MRPALKRHQAASRHSAAPRAQRAVLVALWLCSVTILTGAKLVGAACTASARLEGSVLESPSAATYNAKGEYFVGRGDSACAMQAFRNALRVDGEAWLPRFNLGLVHLGEGRLGEALTHLEIAVGARPDHLDARLAHGSALLGLRRLEGAVNEFEVALEIAPRSIESRQRLAEALIEQGRHVAAIGHAESALEIDPDAPETILLLGHAHSRNGRPELAAAALGRLVSKRPSHFAGRFNLAAAYAQQDRFAEALEHFAGALELDPGHAMARLSAAKAAVNMRDFQRALDLTSPWADAVPEAVGGHEVRYLRGIALRALGDTARAEDALRGAVEMNGETADAHRALGELLAQQGRLAEARMHLQRARELDPDSQQLRFALISVLSALGDAAALESEQKSFEDRKRRIQLEGLAARAAERAAAYLKSGDKAAALREYEQALDNDPSSAELHYGRALALAGMDRQADRIDSLKTAAALDPSLAPAHNELGLALASLGRAGEAEAAYRAAIAADPQYAAARGNLGVLRVTQGRHAEAQALFRRAVEDDPDSAHMRVNHGLALAALGRLDDAEDAVRQAISIDPAEPKAAGALALIDRLRRSRTAVTPGPPR